MRDVEMGCRDVLEQVDDLDGALRELVTRDEAGLASACVHRRRDGPSDWVRCGNDAPSSGNVPATWIDAVSRLPSRRRHRARSRHLRSHRGEPALGGVPVLGQARAARLPPSSRGGRYVTAGPASTMHGARSRRRSRQCGKCLRRVAVSGRRARRRWRSRCHRGCLLGGSARRRPWSRFDLATCDRTRVAGP